MDEIFKIFSEADPGKLFYFADLAYYYGSDKELSILLEHHVQMGRIDKYKAKNSNGYAYRLSKNGREWLENRSK